MAKQIHKNDGEPTSDSNGKWTATFYINVTFYKCERNTGTKIEGFTNPQLHFNR